MQSWTGLVSFPITRDVMIGAPDNVIFLLRQKDGCGADSKTGFTMGDKIIVRPQS
jgi:hypothetical protein